MRKKTLLGVGGTMLVAVVGAYFYLGVDLSPHQEYVEEPAIAAEDSLPARPSAYGIPLDGFRVDREKLKSGDTFSALLAPKGISAARIDSLVRLADPVFNVNRMRAGHPIAYIMPDDTDGTPAYFVYEADQVDHVVFKLDPPCSVHVEKRPVHTEEKSMSVEVTGALWNDLIGAGADPSLAAELSRVFAWTVDFYRIQKGDRFTMVYKQQTVDGEPYGQPVLLGVRYEGASTQEAFLFEKDNDKGGYYDAEGKSLKKAFLQAPLKYSRISSGFSLRRFHPVQKRMKAHLGTDYAAPYGTPILSVGDGTVTKAGYTAGNGNYVKIRHNHTYETQYLHMRKILVKQGQAVKQGQVIGEVGSTGLATGPHVCYRFWKNGKQVDPRREVLPSAEPLAQREMPAFAQVRDGMLARLDEAEDKARHTSVATF
ncbi:MAG TPA: peptidoglycan DD-metalloendopeptidase family protein [Flavobacteriales bacterium]|nr:peptidoglycan DD-metalloendopeptidase family protein [Flavobacteriales bacterium]HRO40270.1 peptidoglycan DD-metalloendopeptidase family protein [Flavobacteriales bacterium]